MEDSKLSDSKKLWGQALKSAWFVFSAMGFYPLNPCEGEYVIGAPQVPKVTLNIALKAAEKGKDPLVFRRLELFRDSFGNSSEN